MTKYMNEQIKELIIQEQKILLLRLEELYKYPSFNEEEIKNLWFKIEENKKILSA